MGQLVPLRRGDGLRRVDGPQAGFHGGGREREKKRNQKKPKLTRLFFFFLIFGAVADARAYVRFTPGIPSSSSSSSSCFYVRLYAHSVPFF
jgi:hypothetical protein